MENNNTSSRNPQTSVELAEELQWNWNLNYNQFEANCIQPSKLERVPFESIGLSIFSYNFKPQSILTHTQTAVKLAKEPQRNCELNYNQVGRPLVDCPGAPVPNYNYIQPPKLKMVPLESIGLPIPDCNFKSQNKLTQAQTVVKLAEEPQGNCALDYNQFESNCIQPSKLERVPFESVGLSIEDYNFHSQCKFVLPENVYFKNYPTRSPKGILNEHYEELKLKKTKFSNEISAKFDTYENLQSLITKDNLLSNFSNITRKVKRPRGHPKNTTGNDVKSLNVNDIPKKVPPIHLRFNQELTDILAKGNQYLLEGSTNIKNNTNQSQSQGKQSQS